MQEFKIEGDYIQLIQLLKALNWVEHGAMAQLVVSEGYVKYNGQVDYRKRLKLRPGDVVEFDGMEVKLV
ncbi:RNA-binding S4 domain-containing protein [Sphingobacterium thalpophilum]|uniref:RNA-binding S4 domain-containing protein n=1 Tax=Sphingobacterium thalpophilum TaxID=259 RepID=A0A4V6KTZ2_9SPHI|nr:MULTISPECIES: RNA-binding S4 domain-containing protein [Sphingobacterium]MCW8311754.1 RNA-binding S4 domain-containing protein [Sphingobacterium sp. InxBP1]VTR52918.1 ribosome-associated protein [Sphingobacterium thalpophilum]